MPYKPSISQLLFILAAIWLAACGGQEASTPQPTPPAVVLGTPTVQVVTSTPLPTATITPTPLPTTRSDAAPSATPAPVSVAGGGNVTGAGDSNPQPAPPPVDPRAPVARLEPGPPDIAALATAPNLLANPGWEGGYSWNNDNLAAPNGWTLEYAQQEHPFLSDQDNEWLIPELVVWAIGDAPDWEVDLLFLNGEWTFKVFGGWKPIWLRMSQQVSAPPGQRLRLIVPVYPDPIIGYDDDGKIFSDELLASEARLLVTTAALGQPSADLPADLLWEQIPLLDRPNALAIDVPGVVADSGYFNGGQMPYGAWSTLVLEFDMPAEGIATVAFELRGRWGLINNGWFVDGLSLQVVE